MKQSVVRPACLLLQQRGVGARPSNGFTLAELLITFAVFGILAAIAVPGYLEQMNKARRCDARRSLHEVANQLERCHSRFRAYNDPGCDIVSAGPTVSLSSHEGHYLITSAVLAVDSYTLEAVPQGTQAGDTTCASLTLTNGEIAKAWDANGKETSAECWQR